jgi:hypothetical protein
MITGVEHVVIDEHGYGTISCCYILSNNFFSCSTDINIFGHPHYDTYHDLALVHLHAFKVPDNSRLSIRCSFLICSDIADADGVTNCDQIPTVQICIYWMVI